MAQMEAFQWILNDIKATTEFEPIETLDYQLVFSYQKKLLVGNFYKLLPNSPMVSFLKETINDQGFHSFKETPVREKHLLYKFENEEELSDFHNKFLGVANMQRPELIFQLISGFVSDLNTGIATSPFIYDVRNLDSGTTLPFIETSADEPITPVSLITRSSKS
ncbi:hypothetical protein ACFQ44_05800 [Levilactobacillus lanxiensis]|uniref:Uncharacterized protein n=1 Tax=Levilactobacillus lanxiensis TaxID=2799568 RepID=A0ABW4D0W4_9LACO|nr:hypothetical protein [Levilactobacillus lanxiensis]